MGIERVQVGDHEMKTLNVHDDNTIFLSRDINHHTTIQSILKSFEKAYSSKISFLKFHA